MWGRGRGVWDPDEVSGEGTAPFQGGVLHFRDSDLG